MGFPAAARKFKDKLKKRTSGRLRRVSLSRSNKRNPNRHYFQSLYSNTGNSSSGSPGGESAGEMPEQSTTDTSNKLALLFQYWYESPIGECDQHSITLAGLCRDYLGHLNQLPASPECPWESRAVALVPSNDAESRNLVKASVKNQIPLSCVEIHTIFSVDFIICVGQES